MKIKLVTVCAFFSFCLTASAQIQGDGGAPKGKTIQPSALKTVLFQEPDVVALRAEDAINDAEKTGPWRFGYNNDTWINMENAGEWYELTNGGKLWIIKLKCKNAYTVNLTFENLVIPKGNELYVYNEDKSFILGKFTDNHVYEGQLGTELVPGEVAIVEYYVAPQNKAIPVSLSIDKVTHGYRTASEYVEKGLNTSGNCNMNVNCPDGAAWGDQKRGAVMLVSGSNGFCSGSMINNTANDGKPYVLTANHCYSNPATWIFRFNWEAATCTNPTTSPTFQSLSGAVLRSRRTPTDFCLVEITGGLQGGTVPASYNTYFSGWDNSGTVPTSTVSIHHPDGDIKKISFDDNPASAVQAMGSSEATSSWMVSWDRNTTTEGGSSGSPLFDQNHRIIGQLWGGGASCSNLSAADYYGRVAQSWEPAGSNSTNQLKYWLDPSGSGVTVLDGYDPNAVSVSDDAGIQSVTEPMGTYCETSVTPSVVLRNYGMNNLTSVTILYASTGVAQQIYNWTGTLAPGATATVVLPTMTVNNGNSTFTVQTSQPNGVADNNTANDLKTSTFTATANALPLTVTISTDCYGYETYWRILDGSSAVVLSGGNQSVQLPGGAQNASASGAGAYGNATTYAIPGCLPQGCYTFEIYDDYGDGLSSSSGPGCSTSGAGYSISDGSTTLVSMTSATFGATASHNFCLGIASPCSSASPLTATTASTISSGNNGTATVTPNGGVSPYTYSWSGPGGFTSSNQNLSGLVPGTYTVAVTDDCGTVTNATVVVQSSVGINSADAHSFAVYPNPNSGKFTIEFAQDLTEEYTISIMDLTGRTIYTTSDSKLKKVIDLDNLATGKYILNVRTATSSTNQSVLIR
ncbi:MAG: T9SS type A sorting domain-containing protein [Crocinitomicaceae bacterium]|nr:T9SS type A sorting domain-containing protein [Crocinitomicaceae bacterium]